MTDRDNLDQIIGLKAVDLGYTYDERYGCSPGSSANSQSKKHFPSLYISDRKDDIDLPMSGEARVKFRVVSKTTNQDREGVKRHSANIEIESIDPVESVKKIGVTRLSAREELSSIISFQLPYEEEKPPMSTGKKIAIGGGLLAAGLIGRSVRQSGAAVRKADGSKLYNGIIDETIGGMKRYRAVAETGYRRGVAKAKAREAAEQSQAFDARKELDSIINLGGFDPRPRNDLGMFSGMDDMGPNPDAIHQTYKAPRVSPLAGLAKKLKGIRR